MTTAAKLSPPVAAVETGTARVMSIDILRGLTILVMVFVNEVAGVRGLPWWTYHMPSNTNGMTYVDMVFPTFLFIVGLSLPIAMRRRVAHGDSQFGLWRHLIVRSVSLMVMGTVLANHYNVDPANTGLSRGAWTLLAYAAILAIWIVYPRAGKRQNLFRILRGAGLLLLAYLLLTFRRRLPDGQIAGLDFSYLEILGLIGEAYLVAGAIYLLSRARMPVLAIAFAALTALNIVQTAGWMHLVPGRVVGSAAHTSIVLAGVVASMLIDRPRLIAAYAAVLGLAGWAAAPLGIAKNHATPAWCLYSAAAAVVLFLALYWIADRKRLTGWAGFVKPAGANTLLTYLLPWIWSAVPFLRGLGGGWNSGMAGVVRAFCFTAVILGIAAVLTRLKIRMQL